MTEGDLDVEQFKIEYFQREHPGEAFPAFVTLSPDEALRLRQSLAAKARFTGDDKNGDSWDLLTYVVSRSSTLRGANADGSGVDLAEVTHQAGLAPREYVYVNWDDFRTIDRFAFADLCRYFEDIWYPGPDDVEIFDDGLDWVLFIHHYGAVDLTRLEDERHHGPEVNGKTTLPH